MGQQALVDQFLQKLKFSGGAFSSSVLFDLGDDGCVFVDAGQTPAEVAFEEREADIRLVASQDLLEGFLHGTKDPNLAFMTGKLKIKGPMNLAMKLNSVFDD